MVLIVCLLKVCEQIFCSPIHELWDGFMYFHAYIHSFIYVQAVGDTGQGWGDAIPYILFSREIWKRLFLNPLKQILQKCCSVGKHIGRVNQQGHNIDSERSPIVPQMTRTITGCPSYTHFTVQHEESDVSWGYGTHTINSTLYVLVLCKWCIKWFLLL